MSAALTIRRSLSGSKHCAVLADLEGEIGERNHGRYCCDQLADAADLLDRHLIKVADATLAYGVV